MAIIIDEKTRVLIQGITGKEGQSAAKGMLEYGTKVVCGVTPGKGGDDVYGIPVYDSVKEALEKHHVDSSVVYVPAFASKDAVIEAISAGIKTIIVITETIPIHDTAEMVAYARQKNAMIIGPSSIGIISPGKAKIGSVGGPYSQRAYSHGNIGIISKSGGMCSETSLLFKNKMMGESTVVGIGGDVLSGSTFVDIVKLFEKDDETEIIVIYGEIGGTYEEELADYIKKNGMKKPIVAFIAGKFAGMLQNVSLGHAGAIIERGKGAREEKVKLLKEAGVHIAEVHHELPLIVKTILDDKRSFRTKF